MGCGNFLLRCASAVLLTACAVATPPATSASDPVDTESPKKVDRAAPQTLADGDQALTVNTLAVVDRVAPSIVHLYGVLPPRRGDDPSRSLAVRPLQVLRAGVLGSGFIVSPGLVATSAHVVEHTASLRARLADGAEYPVRVVALDNTHDLALLRLEGSSAPALPMTSSVRRGESVIAIGNAFGLGCSATVGVVTSGLDALPTQLIQTDAVIQYQNTGGPLVNMRGQVVGINDAKTTDNRSVRGMSYAVPATSLADLVDRYQSLRRRPEPAPVGPSALRGVEVEALGEEHEARTGSGRLRYGVLVTSVGADTPAGRFGFAAGDIIVEMNLEAMASPEQFESARSVAGEQLVLLLREGRLIYVLLVP